MYNKFNYKALVNAAYNINSGKKSSPQKWIC